LSFEQIQKIEVSVSDLVSAEHKPSQAAALETKTAVTAAILEMLLQNQRKHIFTAVI